MSQSLLELLVLSAVTGTNAGLFGLAFLIYVKVNKRFDLLFAAYFVIGAYAALTISEARYGARFVLGLASGVGVFLMAVLIEKEVHQRITRWTGKTELCLVASLGLYFVVENAIGWLFGDAARTVALPAAARSPTLGNGLVHLSASQLATGFISLAGICALSAWFWMSGRGLLARGAGCNERLAVLHGLRLSRTLYVVAGSTAVAASVSGAAYTLDLQVYPSVGMRSLLVAVAIALSARQAGPMGVLARAMLLSSLAQLSAFLFGPRWADLSTYAVFLGVVGWVGVRERKLVALRRQ
ncbi:MAG TPA: hypothetical protein PLL76_18730 [Thermoanaerobaculia bacterium]|nr:hypothetical protein [Thermoanaerobaculia bacterium]HQP88289.1 hypothetical protein [Thermoanaerobaculia bacterium]